MVSGHHSELFLLFFTLYSLFSPILFSLADDRSALLRLRAAVHGHNLVWDTAAATPCSWEGITCDHKSNRVIAVRLPGAGLTGRLPPDTIGCLTELRALSLRHNSLRGPLPSDLTSCSLLRTLHLEGNKFSGEIPESISNLANILSVNLGANYFSGALPNGFNNLTNLRSLFLENNGFSGSLPDLGNLTMLRQFNGSFNGFSGQIPTSLQKFSAQSFIGTSLCGGYVAPCSSIKKSKIPNGATVGIHLASGLGFLLLLILSFILWRKCKKMKSSTLVLSVSSPMPPTPIKLRPVPKYSPTSTTFSSPNHSSRRLKMTIKNDRGIDGLEFFGPDDMRVFTLPELFRSSAELLGKGSVGSTYKAYLESGVEVIVKRLRNVSISEREFRWKVEEIGWLVHENLLPLIGYFYGGEEKLVIFQAMPSSGSLSSLLHGNKNKALSWESRMKIALETAQGIEYIHSTGPQAAHGNVKSSNIFITKHSTARISEFGLTQLVFPAPTINAYRPPKSATDKSGPNSQSADVYSFGVTLLELLTGRSPDYALMSEGIKLPDWVRSVVQEKGPVGAFDRALVRCDVRHQMERLLDVAMDCTMWNPESRPSMVEITGRIREI